MLRHQGKILYVGSSNFAGWHIAKAQEAAARRNFMGLVSEQSIYNLLVRDVEREVLPAAEDYGLGRDPVVAAPRRVARRRRAQGARRQPALRRPRRGDHREAAAPARGVRGPLRGAGRGSRHRRAGLAADPSGGDGAHRRAAHARALDSALRAVEVTLDDKVLARLDELFPGHKTAPEDYAW